MTTVADIQRALNARGENLAVDGDLGPKTLAAIMRAIERVEPSLGELDDARPVSGAAVTIQKASKATRAINEVIVHCTATPEGRDVSVDTIRGWHRAKGWNDIGYHWVVMLDGTLAQGRSEGQIGAHVEGHNTGTLGIVYVGGVAADGKTAKDTRTPAQKATLLAAVKALIAKYPTIKKVTGHNAYSSKACPSFDVSKDPLGKLV